MTGIKITRMRESYIPEILDIERVSFGMPWSMNAFLRVLENPAVLAYIAELNSKLAGYICILEVGREAEVLKLAVAPHFRRMGVAKELNALCIEALRERGCRSVYLEVRMSNRAAISLYEGFGFEPDGIRQGYYRSPAEDALVMKLVL